MEKFEAKARGKMDVKNGTGLLYMNSRILCREASERRSSSVYCRRAEGVPFKWEKKPGTPNINPNNNNNIIPPLSPPPSLQNLGLPLPCFDHETEQQSKNNVLFSWNWRKKIKKLMLHAAKIIIIGKKSGGGGGGLHEAEHKSSETNTHHQGENFGVEESDIAFSNFSSSSSSSSSSSGSNNGPNFCYSSPWNIKAMMHGIHCKKIRV